MTNEQLAAQKKQMIEDMRRAFDHFALSPEARRMARISALANQGSASACYRAIANSLQANG